MPNTVDIYWDKDKNEWNAHVFTGREDDDWGKWLWHKDLDAPNIKRLPFVAHHDELMALLHSDDPDNALCALVMNSIREHEKELQAMFDEHCERKKEELCKDNTKEDK